MEAFHAGIDGYMTGPSELSGSYLIPGWFIVCGLGATLGGGLLRGSHLSWPLITMGLAVATVGAAMCFRGGLVARGQVDSSRLDGPLSQGQGPTPTSGSSDGSSQVLQTLPRRPCPPLYVALLKPGSPSPTPFGVSCNCHHKKPLGVLTGGGSASGTETAGVTATAVDAVAVTGHDAKDNSRPDTSSPPTPTPPSPHQALRVLPHLITWSNETIALARRLPPLPLQPLPLHYCCPSTAAADVAPPHEPTTSSDNVNRTGADDADGSAAFRHRASTSSSSSSSSSAAAAAPAPATPVQMTVQAPSQSSQKLEGQSEAAMSPQRGSTDGWKVPLCGQDATGPAEIGGPLVIVLQPLPQLLGYELQVISPKASRHQQQQPRQRQQLQFERAQHLVQTGTTLQCPAAPAPLPPLQQPQPQQQHSDDPSEMMLQHPLWSSGTNQSPEQAIGTTSASSTRTESVTQEGQRQASQVDGDCQGSGVASTAGGAGRSGGSWGGLREKRVKADGFAAEGSGSAVWREAGEGRHGGGSEAPRVSSCCANGMWDSAPAAPAASVAVERQSASEEAAAAPTEGAMSWGPLSDADRGALLMRVPMQLQRLAPSPSAARLNTLVE